jgi:hypothetical protein
MKFAEMPFSLVPSKTGKINLLEVKNFDHEQTRYEGRSGCKSGEPAFSPTFLSITASLKERV